MSNSIRIKRLVQIVFLLFFFSFSSFGQEQTTSDSIRTIPDLQKEIEKVLEDTGTPAVGLALVQGDSTIWVAGLGKANIEKDVEATKKTMFRIGSTSKMFVSLAMLKLQEEGKINLKDKVYDLIPEIEFENPWRSTTPILVEHLLEHTTGWDDIHLTEYALNKPELSLKEGLDFHPHSRKSRWMPGTRMSYCNSGPPVAAYIVEKITGQNFEDYIKEQFFGPMGMKNSTYFESDLYKQLGATLYINEEPQPYWNIIVRPSGSINASAEDMANFVKLFIGRGRIDSLQLINASSLKRMETPSSTLGAMAGLEHGYGLSNYTSTYKSFTYQGHNGGVNGGLTDFAYLPNHNLGYVVMINSDDGSTLTRIANLIREFQTANLASDKRDYISVDQDSDSTIDGYYVSINPRTEMTAFIDQIMNVMTIRSGKNFLKLKGLFGGETKTFSRLSDEKYVSSENGKITLVKVQDPLEGDVIHMNTTVLKRISPISVYTQNIVGGLWLIYLLGVIIIGTIWFLGYLFGKISKRKHVNTYFWPYLTCLLCFLVFVFFIVGISNPFELLGKPSFVSLGIMIMTICIPVVVILSIITLIKNRKLKITRHVYWHFVILTGLNFVVTCFLMWNGFIGIRVWA